MTELHAGLVAPNASELEETQPRRRHSLHNMRKAAGFAIFMAMMGSHVLAASDRGDEKKFRNVLPEPIDVVDHAGNFLPSMMITAAPLMYTHSLLGSRPRLAKAAIWAGTFMSLAANAAAETKLGGSIIPADQGTPQALDFVYGAGATLFTASILYPRDKAHSPAQTQEPAYE